MRQQLKRLENRAQRVDCSLAMKSILVSIVAAVVLVGCGESQQSTPSPETEPVEPVAEAAQPKPPTAKAPDISIHDAVALGNNEAVKQHLTAGTDVNAKDESGWTPLHWAASKVHNKTAKLLIKEGADVNAVNKDGLSPLDYAENETFGFLIDHGAKSGAELKAKGK